MEMYGALRGRLDIVRKTLNFRQCIYNERDRNTWRIAATEYDYYVTSLEERAHYTTQERTDVMYHVIPKSEQASL